MYRSVGISLHRDRVVSGSLALLRYGFPLALTGLAGMFAFQFDRLVVSRNFTPALYAVYAIGAVELPLSVIVQQAVNAVLVPAMTRHYAAGDMPGLTALWKRAIRRTSLVLLPTFVFFMLTAEETVRILYGAAYHESAVVFRIYLCLVPLRVATYGIITQAIGKTRVNLSASLVLLAVNAVLVLALVGPLGLPGPAVATVLATFITAGYYLIRLRGILNLRLRVLFPVRLVAGQPADQRGRGRPSGAPARPRAPRVPPARRRGRRLRSVLRGAAPRRQAPGSHRDRVRPPGPRQARCARSQDTCGHA